VLFELVDVAAIGGNDERLLAIAQEPRPLERLRRFGPTPLRAARSGSELVAPPVQIIGGSAV